MKYILTLIILISGININAQNNIINSNSGTLDSSFGNNGISLTNINESFPKFYDLAALPDGSFIAAGTITSTTTQNGILLFKYTKDGLPFTEFGDGGKATVYFDNAISEAYAVVIQNDGKILVTGYTAKGLLPANYDIPIIRFNADGKPDSSFGKNGIAITDLSPTDIGYDITLQSDGKILIAGKSNSHCITLRYLQNGNPDESFGDDGKVITEKSASGTAIALDADEKIINAGVSDKKILLVRYNNDGSLDNSFGKKGIVLSDLTKNSDIIRDMLLQPDGKIIIAGQTTSISADSAIIARYNNDGSIDNSFGKDGFTVNPIKFGSVYWRIALQQDNKILTAGYIGSGLFDTLSFLSSRFNNDGTADVSFGNNGDIITPVLTGGAAYGLAIQNDGKIVLAGNTIDNFGNYYVALVRYNNDGLSKKQIIVSKIRRWLQHHNGFTWDANNNISSYVVQRSYDGVHFNSLSRIHTGNNSNYTYADPSPLSGNNYYRLQTTSVSGAVTNSNVIAVTNNDIRVSPNPAKNSLHIEGLSTSNNIKLTVIDFSGNIAISQQLTANSSFSFNLNIALLKRGDYLLKIETNDGVVTKKFVKE